MSTNDRENSDGMLEKLVAVNRVSKTVKGGRVQKFSALCVVGDGKGRVGFGLGKAGEVSEAIRKGLEDAKKNIVNVTLYGNTIPHEVLGHWGASRVLMKPAPEGTGIIASSSVRAILEVAGVQNILTKSLRRDNPHNVVRATFDAIKNLRKFSEIAASRGKTVAEITE